MSDVVNRALIREWCKEAHDEWQQLYDTHHEQRYPLPPFRWEHEKNIVRTQGSQMTFVSEGFLHLADIVDSVTFPMEKFLEMTHEVSAGIVQRWEALHKFMSARQVALESHEGVLRKQLSSWKLLRSGVQPP